MTTIDAAGKFVVPGFLEMHTHVLGEKETARDLKLLLDAGVTGFRLMGGSDKLLKERREGAPPWSDEAPGDTPELLAMPGAVLNPANAGTVKAAVTTVREQHAAGPTSSRRPWSARRCSSPPRRRPGGLGCRSWATCRPGSTCGSRRRAG